MRTKQGAGVQVVHDRGKVRIRREQEGSGEDVDDHAIGHRKSVLSLAAAKWIKEHPGSDKEEDEEEKR